MKLKPLLPIVALLALGGCATVNKQALDPGAVARLKGQTLVQTKRPAPDFVAMTPSKAAIALVGLALAVSEGNAMVSGHAIQDPAQSIAEGLASALSSAHGTKTAAAPLTVSAQDAATLAKAADGSAQYVLDVQTTGWQFTYFPTDWTHYRVLYWAKARLIDTTTKTTVAEGFCERFPESNTGAPSYDELTGNGAALLKKELAIAAEDCVKSLKAEMLVL
ncbi:hypothetical protein ACS5PK_01595 [Roseateles sp. DB2]|uniref:hypothetical protein n=1 Tax=Roseateles sp. DB2 TaxID=3453717 RepID=UPI003EEC3383